MSVKKTKLNIFDNIINFGQKHFLILLLIVLAVSFLNLFYCLQSTPIDSWDEARHGVSAYEMLKNNEFVVNTYAYKNDYWNLKPPLSFWVIMLGYKIAGFNALGLRLFSAVAAFLTILFVAVFAKVQYGKPSSLITALVLTTSPHYILYHGARTGDADALFVLFFTVAMISMMLIERNIKWLYLSGFAFALAFLTKSWHALNIAIIIGLYLFLTGNLFRFKIRQWGMFFITSFSPIFLWAIFRYLKDGFTFFKMMIKFDLLARSAKPLEGHVGGNAYYLILLQQQYLFWLQLLVISLLIFLVLYKDSLAASLHSGKGKYWLALILWIVVPILTFTKAQTKIGWYILPLYPALAIAVGALSGKLLSGVKRTVLVQGIIIVLLLQGIFSYQPYIKKRIENINKHTARVTIKSYEGISNFKGSRAYITTGTRGLYWRQSDLLTAELYGDLIPVNGGLKRFLKDKNRQAILIIPKNKKACAIILKYNLYVVAESKSEFILRKSFLPQN